MLVHLSKESLLAAMQHVLKAIPSNCPIPILSGIHIQAFEHAIMFTSSNTSMMVQYSIPQITRALHVIRAGSIVVPARYFYEIIRKLDEEAIVLEIIEGPALAIASGLSRFRLCGIDAAEFPLYWHKENHHCPAVKIRINNALLKSSIKQVAAAASTSEARPVLTGVSFEHRNDSLNLVATDGVRLAMRIIRNETKGSLDAKVIIPWKNLYEIARMLEDNDQTTEIEVDTTRITFKTNHLLIQSVLIDGTFPSIHHVIPKSYHSELIVETSRLLHAVERASILAKGSIIKLVATATTLQLSSQTTEVGETYDEIALTSMHGENFMISLNSKYFIDMLRCLDDPYAKLQFASKDSPIVLLPAGDPSSALFLITPVRTAS
ncbi:DNA polymerase III subunit beta [Paenibacillus sp. MMS18-CY102]|uniref:DNA polymerase III subunit beta n=1 Tax=Paenibacillus sp. MMS18-CY102 TaxID=2682849 RepID=UPI00136597AA|nr:DNA polymerase III subunit beta [Paenibacillus sp. MMS18-CY102]MWC26867.1 DNA polymerase III subunit beta [Paenibacillus sp. MMS18-CY102]